MQVESSFSIAEAERIAREMEGRGTDTSITLPTNSRGNAGGGEPAVLQALLTWAASQGTARIGTHARGADDDQLETFTRHLVGMCAGLVADRIVDLDGDDVTEVATGLALERLEGLQGFTPEGWSRGSQVEIVCADHLGRGAPEALYVRSDDGTRLASRKEFDQVADRVLAQAVPENAPIRSDRELKAGLADALYELFRNTDEYGLKDERGNLVARSIRGIHARRQAISRPGLARMVQGSAPLASYCDRLQPREGRRDIQLLEVSVFDSGPGYAPHWLERPLSDIGRDEEVEAIRTCFAKHSSRKRDRTAGMGLCTVVDILRRRNGFLRLRTGRQSLYADLGVERERAYGDLPDLLPWQEARLAPMTGTLFTFVMPL